LQLVTDIGRKELIAIVPQTIAVLSNVIQPFVKESPIQLITRLRLHEDSIGLLKADSVDRIVFGTYQSPNFLNAQQYIPNTPTATALTLPSANSTVQFHAYIPSSPMPPGG
jgi:hypothetical protein